ncbi:MAG: hypothetical protein K9J85_10030 [Desulfobacteraceae bacterium]|nr:hypothetical protein [Desulfobacteraceae bacterium]
MPEEASDLIMTIIFLAAVELSRGNYQDPGINTDAINMIAGENYYDVANQFIRYRGQQ